MLIRGETHPDAVDARKGPHTKPSNSLTEAEKRRIVDNVNSADFVDLSPKHIVPILAENNRYIGSDSTVYRVLKDRNQLAHRGKAKPRRHSRPKAFTATAPNQVWSWDITYLRTRVAGVFFYLYLVVDVFSRKIVGWEVHEREADTKAARLMAGSIALEQPDQGLVIHSDNGAPMKGATLRVTLDRLGVLQSFSRPAVSDDNPYSEALFPTLKYRPEYPSKPFADLAAARKWVAGFTHLYSEIHRHSAIKFVTPHQRHAGLDHAILARRAATYEAAKARNPQPLDRLDPRLVPSRHRHPQPLARKTFRSGSSARKTPTHPTIQPQFTPHDPTPRLKTTPTFQSVYPAIYLETHRSKLAGTLATRTGGMTNRCSKGLPAFRNTISIPSLPHRYDRHR